MEISKLSQHMRKRYSAISPELSLIAHTHTHTQARTHERTHAIGEKRKLLTKRNIFGPVNPYLPYPCNLYFVERGHFLFEGCLVYFFIFILILTKILNANSADPDQTPRSVLIGVYAVCQGPKKGTLG